MYTYALPWRTTKKFFSMRWNAGLEARNCSILLQETRADSFIAPGAYHGGCGLGMMSEHGVLEQFFGRAVAIRGLDAQPGR